MDSSNSPSSRKPLPLELRNEELQPPEERSDDYFAHLGLRVGLEIHQQLDTTTKLFCRCPVGYHNEPAEAEILRHMRPTLSEMGTYDGTALMEFKTRKQVHYQLHFPSTCSYEIDDTPPFPVNREALKLGLQAALLFECSLVNEVHVSRKQYLDGSIPTGFQRTAILGINGQVNLQDGTLVPITHCCLEEDACREISDEGHHVFFRTDRLGQPLIEVITDACHLSPSQAGLAASAIGHHLRWAGLARRGPGATRQDVNVSVSGGDRVELKGVARYQSIPALVTREAHRQHRLLELREKLLETGGKPEDLDQEPAEVSKFFARTAWEPLATTLAREHPLPDIGPDSYDSPETEPGQVRVVVLKGWQALLEWQIQPGRPFTEDLSSMVRVIACNTAPYLLTRRALKELKVLGARELEEFEASLKLERDDTYLITWGSAYEALTAAREILARCRFAYGGIPRETRQVLNDHNSVFERVLPGPDRMYPDTDSRPIRLDEGVVAEYHELLPAPLFHLWRDLRESKLPGDWVRELPLSPRWPHYQRAVELGVPPRLAAWACLELLKHLARQGVKVATLLQGAPEASLLLGALRLLKDHPGGRELLPRTLTDLADGGKDLSRLRAELSQMELPDPASLVDRSLARMDTTAERTDLARNTLAGIMVRHRGTVSGAEVARLIHARLEVSP